MELNKGINTHIENLNALYEALKKGVPLSVALTNSGISQTTYFYWVTLASIAHTMKSEKEIQELSDLLGDEDEINFTRDKIFQETEEYQNEVITKFVEPKETLCYKYQRDEKFRNLCDEAYQIIKTCDESRCMAIAYHINKVAMDGHRSSQGRINARASMWFLERALPTIFGKKEEEELKPSRIEKKPLKVQFVDPNEKNSLKRVEEMTNELMNVSTGKVDA